MLAEQREQYVHQRLGPLGPSEKNRSLNTQTGKQILEYDLLPLPSYVTSGRFPRLQASITSSIKQGKW